MTRSPPCHPTYGGVTGGSAKRGEVERDLEAGATGSPPAVVNAVVSAVVSAVVYGLSGLGVTHVDMPLWPRQIWDAIRNAGSV